MALMSPVFRSSFHLSVGSKLINGEITGHDAERTFGAMPRASDSVSARVPRAEVVISS